LIKFEVTSGVQYLGSSTTFTKPDSKVRQRLDDDNMISLPAPDGRGEARAKRADQKSKEGPQQ
jgi:hypothetical protein